MYLIVVLPPFGLFITPVEELTAILELLLVNVPVKALPVLLVGVIFVSGSKVPVYSNGIVASVELAVILHPLATSSASWAWTTEGASVICELLSGTLPLFEYAVA